MEWLKQRWAEPSTRAGLGTIAATVAGMLPPTYQPIALAAALILGGQAVAKKG